MSNWSGDERREDHWHIRKEVTWGHIMTTVSLLFLAVGAWINTTGEISENRFLTQRNAREIEHVRELNRIQGVKLEAAIQRVEEQYEKIDLKLDSLRDALRGQP